MKTPFLLLLAQTLISFPLAQTPYRINYQAVVRNSSNALVVNSPVGMKISILQGSISGVAVYSENHNPTSNANGIINIEIGGGTSQVGKLSEIRWENGPFFLKTEVDPSNGTNYTIAGTSQLLSVPFALHASSVSASVSSIGDTLIIGNNRFIVPGITDASQQSGITTHTCGAANVHNPSLNYGVMNDQVGNTYRTIRIGTQTWMAENLKTTKYRNGDTIPNVNNISKWVTLKTGAQCSYNNNPSNDCPYGKLYNWYAVNDSRKLCPTGWHVPNDSEWKTLIRHLDPSADTSCSNCYVSNIAGSMLKSKGTQYFSAGSNNDASNSSGFSALPAGFMGTNFGFQRSNAYWWSSTPITGANNAWDYYLYNSNGNIRRDAFGDFFEGFSVRCIKD